MIKLRLFSSLREVTGVSELVLDENILSCESAIGLCGSRYPDAETILRQCAVARNGNFVTRDTMLEHGDELAILPPVSGG